MRQRLVVVVTRGDRLYGQDFRLHLESKKPVLSYVQDIWKDAKNRYVVFDNTLSMDDPKRHAQVNSLLYIVNNMSEWAFFLLASVLKCLPSPSRKLCRLFGILCLLDK